MTREEAIKALIKERKTALHENKQAFDMAINALEQQPNEDCVSRKELLKLYGNRAFELQMTHQTDKQLGINWCINTLKEMPPVTPTQKWIPVSERLPEKNGKYLAYIINKKDTNLQYIMTCEYYEGDLWNWFPDDDCASDNVVAWMPLPEPYKAEMEDEE